MKVMKEQFRVIGLRKLSLNKYMEACSYAFAYNVPIRFNNVFDLIVIQVRKR